MNWNTVNESKQKKTKKNKKQIFYSTYDIINITHFSLSYSFLVYYYYYIIIYIENCIFSYFFIVIQCIHIVEFDLYYYSFKNQNNIILYISNYTKTTYREKGENEA